MNFLKNKVSGIRKRFKCLSYGIFYFRNNLFQIQNRLKVNGKFKIYNFIDKDNPLFVYEFTETCLNDCYRLKSLSKKLAVKNIVDVGANQGLFAIAARQQFPKASIFCYEPNQQLDKYLSHNANNLLCNVYYEAVTKEDCKVKLEFGETDLLTRTYHSDKGKITGSSLRKVIERAGGRVDILKLDCEGGEWELFEDEIAWKNIRALTMEYHLWAKEGSSFEELKAILEKLNFKILFHNRLTDSFGLVTAINQNY